MTRWTRLFRSTDLELARRIEAGHEASGFCGSHESLKVGGGSAVFAGIGSHTTQALGLGMNGSVSPAEMDELEGFFRERGSIVPIDLSAFADPSVFTLIQERGYQFNELTSVLVRKAEDRPADPEVREAGPESIGDWARLVLRGFMEGDENLPTDMVESLSSQGPGFHAFFGGQASAAGMDLHNGLATLFGDATLPEARGRGMQMKLINHRIGVAFRAGCDLISASVLHGVTSHRNYERAGFKFVYSRVKVTRSF